MTQRDAPDRDHGHSQMAASAEGADVMNDQAITTAKTFRSKISTGSGWWLVVAFSLIGLLVTLNVMLHFPEWGAVMAQIQSVLN
jgi:hypothetical protein